jgi:glycosyltransferase involved in cell wall biosynthesis
VITSNCSSLAEVAGPAAALVDPLSAEEIRNSLERLLTSPGLRESYRQQGLTRAKDFTWAESARRALKFFHQSG